MLRAKALATPDGDSIGSEENLIDEFKVSRPTFRSGAAIVSQEQLLTVRRGPGGGYFATRPNPNGVSHSAAIYLQSQRTKLEEVLLAIEPITVEMAILAAENKDSEIAADWVSFRETEEQYIDGTDYIAFLRSLRQYGQLLGRSCNNKVLELFLSTLYEFCAMVTPDADLYRDRPDRIKALCNARARIIDAIIEGDKEIAAVLTRRTTRMNVSWMVEDISRTSRTGPFGEFPFESYLTKGKESP